MFFYQGLLGLGVFFLIGNIFYYSRIFAGGDSNLMIALGAVIPFSTNLFENINLGILFLLLWLFWGAIYGLVWSIYLGIKNHRKFSREFSFRVRKNKKMLCFSVFFGILFLVFSFFETSLIALALLIFILPYFYFLAKSIDEVSMVKDVKPDKLTVGDWLYKDVKIGKRLIRVNWNGLSEKDILLLKKRGRKIKVRYGIPYAPVFLLGFLTLAILWLINFRGFFVF